MLLDLRSLWEAEAANSASWEQAPATWDATAAETFAATATFTQAAATWAAVAAEAFAATGSWTQAAAAWSAVVAETFASSGAWSQPAAAWDAIALIPANSTSTATWEQAAASWLGVAGGGDAVLPDLQPAGGGSTTLRTIPVTSAFAQSPASWAATLDVNDDELVLLLAA